MANKEFFWGGGGGGVVMLSKAPLKSCSDHQIQLEVRGEGGLQSEAPEKVL